MNTLVFGLGLGHKPCTCPALPPNHHNATSRLRDYLGFKSPSGTKGPLQILSDGLSANLMEKLLEDESAMAQHFPGVELRHKRIGNKLIVAEVGNRAADPHFDNTMRRPIFAIA